MYKKNNKHIIHTRFSNMDNETGHLKSVVTHTDKISGQKLWLIQSNIKRLQCNQYRFKKNKSHSKFISIKHQFFKSPENSGELAPSVGEDRGLQKSSQEFSNYGKTISVLLKIRVRGCFLQKSTTCL